WDEPRDDRNRAARSWSLERHDRLEPARPHEARLLFDPTGPNQRLDAAGNRVRRPAGPARQPDRRLRPGGAARRGRGGGARDRIQRSDGRQSGIARHTSHGAMTDLLRIEDLHVRFDTPGGYIEAVKGVTFRMRAGSTVALVGESGSGKSVVSQSIMRILPRNGEIARGRIRFADPRGDGTSVDLAQ